MATPRDLPQPPAAAHVGRRAFTLVEVLITVAIIAVLLALLLPAARGAVGSARSFKCQMSQRSVAFDFSVFADDQLHPFRGDDDDADARIRGGPARTFRLETFIESQYGVDEFWNDAYGATVQRLPDDRGRDPMRCAEVSGVVELRRNTPCTQGAVSPPQFVSFGFNARMHQSEARWTAGDPGPLRLTGRVLQGEGESAPARVPLLWDVDGATAAQREAVPLLSAPSLDSAGPLYGDGRLWFPSLRHAGALNAAFLDGHVAPSTRPLAEPSWSWSFDPGR
jgi:prepilin-type N-terminal cleavage/methylation domain-containing protein/prepilin-type processing-associated H-X9-DG protein